MTMLDYVEQRQVTGELRDTLLAIEGEDLSVILQLVAAINPSANFLRDCLRLAKEISARDRIKISDVFSETKLFEVLSNSELSPKDKQKQVKEFLQAKRHPEVARIKKRLKESQGNLVKKYGLAIELPHNLEGNTLTFKIEAKNIAEISKAGDALKMLAADSECEDLYAFLLGKTF